MQWLCCTPRGRLDWRPRGDCSAERALVHKGGGTPRCVQAPRPRTALPAVMQAPLSLNHPNLIPAVSSHHMCVWSARHSRRGKHRPAVVPAAQPNVRDRCIGPVVGMECSVVCGQRLTLYDYAPQQLWDYTGYDADTTRTIPPPWPPEGQASHSHNSRRPTRQPQRVCPSGRTGACNGWTVPQEAVWTGAHVVTAALSVRLCIRGEGHRDAYRPRGREPHYRP
jgi:hypothetical protein